ncbi:hypothetical protein EC991_005400, partial [Linnemannia zychae]
NLLPQLVLTLLQLTLLQLMTLLLLTLLQLTLLQLMTLLLLTLLQLMTLLLLGLLLLNVMPQLNLLLQLRLLLQPMTSLILLMTPVILLIALTRPRVHVLLSKTKPYTRATSTPLRALLPLRDSRSILKPVQHWESPKRLGMRTKKRCPPFLSATLKLVPSGLPQSSQTRLSIGRPSRTLMSIQSRILLWRTRWLLVN